MQCYNYDIGHRYFEWFWLICKTDENGFEFRLDHAYETLGLPSLYINDLRFLYEHRLKKYDKPAELVIPPSLESLDENLDVVVNLAERYYYNCDVRETHRISTAVLKKGKKSHACRHVGILYSAVCLLVSPSVTYSTINLVELKYFYNFCIHIASQPLLDWAGMALYFVL